MGRTITPYSMQTDMIAERFKKFRRSLRREDKAIFDALMRYAKMQIQAGVMAVNPNPFDSMAVAMLIELQKQIRENAEEIEKLKRRLKQKANFENDCEEL